MRMPRFCGFVIFIPYIRGAHGDRGNHERLVANFGDDQSRALRQPDRAALLARLSPASFTVAQGVHAGHEHAVPGNQPLRRHSCPLGLRCRPAPSPPTDPWRLKGRMTENGRRARSGPPALRRSIAALQGIRRNPAPMGGAPTGPGEHTPLPCPARTIHATHNHDLPILGEYPQNDRRPFSPLHSETGTRHATALPRERPPSIASIITLKFESPVFISRLLPIPAIPRAARRRTGLRLWHAFPAAADDAAVPNHAACV